MKRKLVYFAVSLVFIFSAATSINVKKLPTSYNKVNNIMLADSQQDAINRSKILVEEAVKEKTFNKFSLAYGEILKIYDAEIRDPLLWKICGITLKVEAINIEENKKVGQISGIVLDEALREKTFYKYNLAYALIMKIQDTAVRDPLLGQLSTITDTVWTPDIKTHVALLADLTSTGSGKIYSKIEVDMGKTSLSDIDKGYLLGELTTWGLNLVYTDDYKNAVDKLNYAWKMLSTGTEQNVTAAITDAQTAISYVKNMYSKAYLTEELNAIKLQTEFSVIEIK